MGGIVEPHTPRHSDKKLRDPDTPKAHTMGNRVICATPRRGKAVSNYSLGDRLGKGAFATVFKAIHLKTAEVAAIKQIPLDKIKSVDSIMGEIELLQDLEHPNIVKYFGFMKDEEYLNIVLEYCENGSLATILHRFGSFPENLVAKYMCQVLEGLSYLHRQGTIHRDIKGANILTTKEGIAKLADFGVATKIIDDTELTTDRHGLVGTPHWMAPEIIQLQVPTPACDIWSLGATIVELRTGRPPYGDRADITAMYAIVQQDSSSIIPTDSSKTLRDFMTLCFEKDPSLRVTASDLLKHTWIHKFCDNNQAKKTITYPEEAIKEWNSDSRRKRLAVPSVLNLQAVPVKKISKYDVDNYEDDFHTLGVFGNHDPANNFPHYSPLDTMNQHHSMKNAESISNEKKPLSAFVEKDVSDYSQYGGDFESASINELKRPSEVFYKSSTASNTDPFFGLEDLLEDEPDEAVICARDEAVSLANLIYNQVCDLEIAFKRLSEIIVSKPQIQKTLEDKRILPRSLTILQRRKNPNSQLNSGVYIAFLRFVTDCIRISKNKEFITNYCIAGGLSFLFANSDLAPSISLATLHIMVMTARSKENEITIARQLAFREDAIAFVCSFFTKSADPVDIMNSASIIWEIFEVCGPRHRANIWHHFNSYGLFPSLVGLLHLPYVLSERSQNPLANVLYQLIVSFSKTPQEFLSDTLNQKIIRRFMRAYINLPIESPHRLVLLEIFRNTSTLVNVLDSMQSGHVGPHLIAALRRALHDPRVTEKLFHQTANFLVPTLFNYARIERNRQREVARNGLLPLLQECVRRSPGLREFVFPIFSALAHANHPECWVALWNSDALETFIGLISETGWQAVAISAVAVWMQAQPDEVHKVIYPRLNVINDALLNTSGSTFESILSAVNTLLDRNRKLCGDWPKRGLFLALKKHISANGVITSSGSFVHALQIILWVTLASKETSILEIKQSGLFDVIDLLENVQDLPILCSRLVLRLKRLALSTGFEKQ